MDRNLLLRRLRYALAIDDAAAARLIARGGGSASVQNAAAWRRRSDEAGYQPCPPAVPGQLLAGLVRENRGAPPPGAALLAPRVPLANNDVVKALKIALSLDSQQLLDLFHRGGATLGPHEMAALLRKPGTRNYRRCGDQLLRQLLSGLAALR